MSLKGFWRRKELSKLIDCISAPAPRVRKYAHGVRGNISFKDIKPGKIRFTSDESFFADAEHFATLRKYFDK